MCVHTCALFSDYRLRASDSPARFCLLVPIPRRVDKVLPKPRRPFSRVIAEAGFEIGGDFEGDGGEWEDLQVWGGIASMHTHRC